MLAVPHYTFSFDGEANDRRWRRAGLALLRLKGHRVIIVGSLLNRKDSGVRTLLGNRCGDIHIVVSPLVCLFALTVILYAK